MIFFLGWFKTEGTTTSSHQIQTVGAMTVSTRGDVRIIRSSRRDVKASRIANFIFWLILIFSSQLCLSSAYHENDGRSPGRKVLLVFNGGAAFHAASNQFGGEEDDSNMIYGGDKRLVHTGPNPLHN